MGAYPSPPENGWEIRMTAQEYKTAVGAFVLGGLSLFVLAIIYLGGANLFNDNAEYVLYFDGSVSGLSVGAPVVFRGVPMGSVTQISLVANARDSNITIPVTIRIDEKSFIRSSGQSVSESVQQEIIRRMIERGLRARLQLQSLITGQYRIELDFFPGTPTVFRSLNPEHEIPTVPSPIDTLQRTLAKLPMQDIANSITDILENISAAVSDNKLKLAIDSFTSTFDEARKLLVEGPLRESVEVIIEQVQGVSDSMKKDLPASLSSFHSAMDNFSRASAQFRKVADSTESLLARDSPFMNDLKRLIKECIASARSINNFVEMLERNPEALLRGRQGKR